MPLLSRSMKRILIVDDEQLIRYALSRALNSEYVDVKAVETGVEAISEITSRPYHLCFLDIFLPDICGIDVMKSVRETSPETKVVIMTGSLVSDEMEKEITDKAYMFIAKPFSIFDIKTIAKQALGLM